MKGRVKIIESEASLRWYGSEQVLSSLKNNQVLQTVNEQNNRLVLAAAMTHDHMNHKTIHTLLHR